MKVREISYVFEAWEQFLAEPFLHSISLYILEHNRIRSRLHPRYANKYHHSDRDRGRTGLLGEDGER